MCAHEGGADAAEARPLRETMSPIRSHANRGTALLFSRTALDHQGENARGGARGVHRLSEAESVLAAEDLHSAPGRQVAEQKGSLDLWGPPPSGSLSGGGMLTPW